MQELTSVVEKAVAEKAVAEKTFGQSPLDANDGSPDETKSKASTPRGVGLTAYSRPTKPGSTTKAI
jgi:hypothetical protein